MNFSSTSLSCVHLQNKFKKYFFVLTGLIFFQKLQTNCSIYTNRIALDVSDVYSKRSLYQPFIPGPFNHGECCQRTALRSCFFVFFLCFVNHFLFFFRFTVVTICVYGVALSRKKTNSPSRFVSRNYKIFTMTITRYIEIHLTISHATK